MITASSLFRRTAAAAAGLLLASLVVVAPSVEQRVAKASSVGLDDTFATFTGSNYFSAPDNDIFDVSGNITVSAWIRPTSLCASSECVFIAKEHNYLFAIKNGTFQYAIMNQSYQWDWRGTGGVVPVLNQWQHVSFTVARSTSTLSMFLNGRQVYGVTNGTDVPNTGLNSVHPFSIAARDGGGTSRFLGSIDEVRVYNTTRASAAQAQADMNTWGPANATGLVLYYDFNEGSGSTLNNRVTGASTATNLTATGSPTWGAVRTQTQTTSRIIQTFARSYLVAAGGWTVPTGVQSADVLVVGGGGGGSDLSDGSQWSGGGGGAGGYRNVSGTALTPGAVVTVSVGGGGHRASKSWASFVRLAQNGADSVFGSIQSLGGGAGGGGSHSGWQNGATGGSGGGGGTYGGLGGAGTSGQGNAGGNAWGYCCGAGGGGGAGSAGGTSTSGTGGAAGNGVSNSISGTAVFYAGGGAGHGDGAAGSAGTSGGTAVGTNGAEGRGSGGGGGKGPGGFTAESAAGHGGIGIVIVSYSVPCEEQIWNVTGGSTLIQYQVPTGFSSCVANYTTPANVTALDAVIVGGGGGGGGGNSSMNTAGGGGGGGQVLNLRAQTVTANTTYQIVVGGGGAGGAGAAGAGTAGSTGIATTAFGSTANGGSGGGPALSSGTQFTVAGDGGSSGSGNAGGGNDWEGGGGGAGAGSPGVNGVDVAGSGAGTGGEGGNGVMPGWVIGWCGGFFGGGGGGGTTAASALGTWANGGPGGGGTGANYSTAPVAGSPHCGGGGGGGGGQVASRNGANGSSGVAYVRHNHAFSAESFTEGSDIEVELGMATNLGLTNIVTDYLVGETVRVRMNVTNGTLSIPTASGTTVTGNNSASVTLVGSQTNLNTALASATLNTATLTSTQLMIDVDMNPVTQTFGGHTYTPHTNGHFYVFRAIPNARVWDGLQAAVGMILGGRQGFLATPTSSAEMTLIRSVAGSSSTWIGITDDFQENTFRLIGEDAWGPISTGATAISGRYVNWTLNEPNNALSLEDYGQLNGNTSTWNDHRTIATMDGAVVEFEPKSSRIMRNVTFTSEASRTATVSTASNLGLGTAHIGASTFVNDETIVATLTAPAGTTLAATGAATITGSGTRTLTLEGTKVNVNATLNNVTVTAGTIGDKSISVSYRAKFANNGTSSNYKYNATTGNFYLLRSAASYTTAETDAGNLRFGGVPGSLVSINSSSEQTWLNSNISTSAFWTALNDVDNEGQWTMRTRDAYQTSSFDNIVLPGGYLPWNTNEPNGARNQNCHASQWASLAGDDGTCSSTLAYVVEFRPFAVTQDVTLAVNAAPSLDAPTTGLTATVGTAYSLTLAASGGVSPYTYNLQSGTLPNGLTLSSAGVISGTATDALQSQAITVRATDANGGTGTSTSFTLTTDASTCTTATTVVGAHTVQRFTDVGYCQWQVPAGVTSIDGFVVGGGGGGGHDGGEGGGGGGYHPRNGIAVTPGEILTIRVGAGGDAGIWGGGMPSSGQSSFVTRGATQLLNANGGAAGIPGPVGTAGAAGGTSTGGFTGGKGGSATTSDGTRGTMGAVGVVNYFLGVVNEYSGGGGGGIYDSGANNLSSALGLSGGGSGCDATSPTSNTAGFPGRVNSGGGGGGGCAGNPIQTSGGGGGSGIAMIRYTTDPLDAFPAGISGLQARFVADDYQTLDGTRKTWIDSSNSARHVTTVGGSPAVIDVTGNGSTKTVRTLSGGTNETLTFPTFDVTSNNYTLFHLARYSGSAKARIFTSTNGNWLSGFWAGVAGVAHHNAWMTSYTVSNASTSHWVLSSDQNTLYRANGRSVTTSTSSLSYSSPLSINTGWAGAPSAERSDWQVPEVIAYNRVLTPEEIRQVESYLTRTYGLLGSDASNVSQGVLSPRTVSATKTGTASTGSSSQLSVTWTAPTDITGVTDYKVEYKTQADTTWSEWAHTANASLTSATLTGLTAGTTYDIRVSAVDSGATNRPSVATTATTWGAPTLALTSTPASPKTSTTYTLVATVTDADNTTGTVAFMENGVAISGCATKAVVSGLATCSWTPATLGARSLTASFTGDSNFLSATTVSATSLTVELGICTTTVGTTGRFTFWQILDTATCELPALPAGVESIDTFVVGGGGGGGSNVGSGGGGGGAYYATNVAADSTDVITVTVGAGGRAGGSSLAGATVDALRDGGAGGTSSISWDSTTFSGAGGSGGETYWSNNACFGSGSQVTARPLGGSGSGTGGTSSTGGSGGVGSSTSGGVTSAGGAGFSNSITGSPLSYGGAGGGGGWSATGGAGGTGGGAAGGTDGIGSSGTANTGGGGGGGGGTNVNPCQYGGQGGSGRVIVRFANTPTITTQPVAASKTRGQSHTFSVTPSATGAIAADFTYQWHKDGVAISGATSSSYTIASLSTTDAGDYSVTVKSSSGGFAVSSVESSSVTLSVDKATQTITFGALSSRTYGDADFSITATASSGLLVSFASDDATVCSVAVGTVSGGVTTATVTLGIVGSCVITASQFGDTEFLAATSTTQTLTVTRKTLTLTGLSAANKEYNRTDTATVDFTNYSFGSSVVGSDVVTLNSASYAATFSNQNVADGKTVTVTGLSLSGAAASNYQLPSPITTTANITAKELNAINITAANKEYDQLLTATLSVGSASLSGVISGDTVEIETGSATGAFATKAVADGKTVTVSGLSLSGTDAGNYTLAGYTTTANITAKQLTATGITAANKEYDQLLTATLSLSSAGLSGVIDGDTVSIVTSSATGAFGTKTVSNGKTVTVSGLTISGTDAGNYTLASYTTTANITAKQLTATGITAANKEYDQLLTATLSLSSAGLSGVIDGDTVIIVTSSAMGAFGSKTVADGKTVTVSGLSLSGTDAGNYTLAGYTTTANITAKQLTATNITAANKEYDQLLTATLSLGSAGLNGVISGDTVEIETGSAAGAFATKTVADGKTVTVSGLSLSGTDAGNYTLAGYTTTANITAKQLTATNITAANKEYDQLLTATLSLGSAGLSGVIDGDTVNIVTSSATGAFATKTVENGKTVTVSGLTISGTDAGNYTLAGYTTTANITAKQVTVTGITASDKDYDKSRTAVVQHGLAQLVGVISGDTVTINTSSITGQFDTALVGNNKTVQIAGVALAGTDAGNYAVLQPTTTASISTKTITVSGVIASNKEYDADVDAIVSFLSATISGIETGDTVLLDVTNVAAEFATKVIGSNKTVSVSGLALSGADAANYRVVQPTAQAAITAKQLTARNITAANKEYDQLLTATLSLGSATLDGVISGDTVNIVTSAATGAFATKTVENGKTVTVSGLSLSGTDAGNYTLATYTTTANITAKQLTATGITAANKEYDQLLTATLSLGSAGLNGVIPGDTVNIVTSSATGAFATKTVENGKTVTVSGLTITGTDSGNYTLAGYTTTANITAKQLTATGITAANKEYDQLLTATLSLGSAGLNGVISGDTVEIETGAATGTFATKTVANGKTVTVSGLTLSGTDSGNYTLAGYTTPANITAKQISATGISAVNKEYDQLLTATLSLGSAGLNGVISGDTVNIVTSSATGAFATKTVEDGKTVTVSGLTLTGTDAINYTLVGYTTTANITAKQVTATNISAANKEYDQLLTATLSLGSAGLNGVISGDTVNIVTNAALGAFANKTVGNGKTVTVSGLTLTGIDSANYTLAGFTTTANITAKQVTATNISAANKEYDQLLTATLSLGSAGLSGVISGDTVNIVTTAATGAFSSKAVANGKTVTVSGLTLAGTDAINYTLAVYTTTANITAKQIMATGISATNKEYDQLLTATLSLGSAGLSGVISGDTVNIETGSATGAFATKSVANGKVVTVSGLTLSGGDAGNYTLGAYATTANITAKQLTATGITAVNKEYNQSLAATLSLGSAGLNGVIAGDTVNIETASAVGTFATKTVANGKTVTVAGLSIDGTDANNYILAPFTTTANITAKQLTATNITAANKEYDQLLTATLSLSSAGLNGVIIGDTVNIVTSAVSGAFANKTVANGKVVTVSGLSLTGGDAGNYTLAGYTTTANITAKQLTATGITAVNKEYNQSLVATLSLGSAGLNGVISGDTVNIETSSATGAFATKIVENGKTVTVSGLTLSGGDAGNYTLAGYTTTANITAKQLTATGITAANKEYDRGLAATLLLGSAGLNGVISGDAVEIETGSATGAFGSRTVATGKTVTVSGLTISGVDAGNYTLAPFTTTANITRKPLTVLGITAANKEYDQLLTATLSTSAAALSGVITNDIVTLDASAATGAFVTKTAANGKPVIVSGLTISGSDAVNYLISPLTVTATITPLSLTVTGITAADKIFDGTTTASISVASASLNGILNNDVVAIDTTNAVGNFVDERVGSNKTVRISGVAVSGLDGPNYVVTQPTTTATIITAVTAWMDYRAEAVTASVEQPVALLTAPQVLPPAPARVSTRSVSGGRSTRVTAVRSVRDAAIPVTHAIITVLNNRNKVLARINVRVDPANPTTAVTVPYARRNVRVTVQFANDIGISKGGPSGANVTQGNTFEWAAVDGRPQIRGSEVPGSLIFARGSTTLTNSMKASLKRMARTVTSRGGLVYVTGYAQNGELASAWRLESLAQKRAEVVARYLTSIGVRQWVTYQGHAGVRDPWNTARERRVAISTEPFYG